MNVGIIGFGSMGKMMAQKFSTLPKNIIEKVYVANRSPEKLVNVDFDVNVCKDNRELAAVSDIIFICTKPGDIKTALEEIASCLKENVLLVSLNGSVTFAMLEKIADCKIAKVIPSVTAEINRSQTLVCYNHLVGNEDKVLLQTILKCMGEMIELPENEMGMGSELVSCMPGFIASIFDVICGAAKKHTSIGEEQIAKMVLNTMTATDDLMLEKNMSFDKVVERVATKGGITEEGTKVVYEKLPAIADELFEKTLEKRRQTAVNVEKLF